MIENLTTQVLSVVAVLRIQCSPDSNLRCRDRCLQLWLVLRCDVQAYDTLYSVHAFYDAVQARPSDNVLVLRRAEILARDASGAGENRAGDLPVPRPLVSRRVVGDAVLVDFVLQATEA